jgi:hypothetical protein
LDAEWEPACAELEVLGKLLDDFRRTTDAAILAGEVRTPLDSALILDADGASPSQRLVRRSAVESVLAVVDSFAGSAAVLANRRENRPGLTIKDEYDVQDLFFALSLPVLPDLVPEDPAPKVANKASRIDFVSRGTGLAVELKFLKSKGDAARVRTEILVDEATYQEHPYVETVVVFVHDPETYISLSGRTAFEADLSKTVMVGSRSVRYIVRVR